MSPSGDDSAGFAAVRAPIDSDNVALFIPSPIASVLKKPVSQLILWGMSEIMRMFAASAALVLGLAGTCLGQAQGGNPREAVHLAFEAEMSQVGHDCPSEVTLADRNVCLSDVRVQTFKNFDAFYLGLREVIIDQSPNDSNALALDAGQRDWEKARTLTCDAVSDMYDTGTIAHPGSIAPSAKARCLIQLTRSRMQDLMQLYGATL
jgi:uncharacterized protein YecT (DUF1311 family)